MAKGKHTGDKKVQSAIPGVLVIVGLAAALTYGMSVAVAEATKPKPVVKKTVVVEEKPVVEKKVATPAPAVTTPVVPAAKTATTKSFVRFRAGRSTSTAVLAELDGGTVVTLGSYSDSLWQQATYNGQTGYIYKRYLNY